MSESLPVLIPAPCRHRWRKIGLWLALLILVAAGVAAWWLLRPRHYATQGQVLSVAALPGDFLVFYFPPAAPPARAIILIGSGDGGWSYWEEKVCQFLAKENCAVVGWDTRAFAQHPYDHTALAKGFAAATQAAREELENPPSSLPVIYGGWSTGAEQSVPAAASEFHDPTLLGLLLVAPGGRGRFGLTQSDLLGIPPSGPGSFALSDYTTALKLFRIAQLHAGIDPLDNIAWLDSHLGVHKLIVQHKTLHDFGNAGDEFQQTTLREAVNWLLAAP